MKLKIPSTFDKGITIPGLSIIFFIAFCCMLVPGISGHYLNIARQWITGTWGWAFIFGASLFILFLLLLCLSRLGDIRLGDEDEEPEYPFLSWVSMLFAAGMGIDRSTLMRYHIDDIRHFRNNDIRFLEQF